MSSNPLDPFRDPNSGGTTQQGQTNAGNWERSTYPSSPQAPQQSYESHDAYLTRINGG